MTRRWKDALGGLLGSTHPLQYITPDVPNSEVNEDKLGDFRDSDVNDLRYHVAYVRNSAARDGRLSSRDPTLSTFALAWKPTQKAGRAVLAAKF